MKPSGGEKEATDLFYGLVLHWICGATWSDFQFLSYIAIAINLYIAWVILFRKKQLLEKINIWVWLLFGMAMFTIWVEPFITILNVKSLWDFIMWLLEELISHFLLSAIILPANIGFSIGWFILTALICQLLTKERMLKEQVNWSVKQPTLQPLVQKSPVYTQKHNVDPQPQKGDSKWDSFHSNSNDFNSQSSQPKTNESDHQNPQSRKDDSKWKF